MIPFLWRKSVICGILPHPPAQCPLGPLPHGGCIPRHQGRGALLPGLQLEPKLSLHMNLLGNVILELQKWLIRLNRIRK